MVKIRRPPCARPQQSGRRFSATGQFAWVSVQPTSKRGPHSGAWRRSPAAKLRPGTPLDSGRLRRSEELEVYETNLVNSFTASATDRRVIGSLLLTLRS
jgi:hypothetical protein